MTDNFRLERSTFSLLVKHVGPFMKKTDTKFRSTISVEQNEFVVHYIVLVIRRSGEPLRIYLGLEKALQAQFCMNFSLLLSSYSFGRLIKFPTSDDEIKYTMNGFLDKLNYPMCLGAVDGTHISIKPFGLGSDYFNYKKFHSVISLLQS